MIILDVDMPRLDGRSVLRQLRHAENWTPIIMLTKEGGSADRTFALTEGADDYINKPFDIHELVARIKAVLRRSNMNQKPLAASNLLICGSIEFNRLSRRIKFDGSDIDLKTKAVSLLEYFFCFTPMSYSVRDRILDAVWGWAYAASSRTVDNQVSELRKQLNDSAQNPRYIENGPRARLPLCRSCTVKMKTIDI